MIVKFWKTNDFYGPFSNFSKHPIEFNNKFYATSEHLYQALKCINLEDHEKVRLALTPKESKQIAHSLPYYPWWDYIKDDIMYMILELKVNQHSNIKELLLSTKDMVIEEASPYDFYWGTGDGTGLNMLGKTLMKLRENIRRSNV